MKTDRLLPRASSLRSGRALVQTKGFGMRGEKERALAAQVEQLEVQLAGCLTAAEGSTTKVARKYSVGWSPAYAAVLDLRLKYDQLLWSEIRLKERRRRQRAEARLRAAKARHFGNPKERKRAIATAKRAVAGFNPKSRKVS